jgi:hypothetical protein
MSGRDTREPSPGTGEGWEGAEPRLVQCSAGPLSISPPFREREPVGVTQPSL